MTYICTINNKQINIMENVVLVKGDYVEVPDPNHSDIHNHSFEGTIVGFKDNCAIVEDGDGDCFDIEVERLTKID